MPATYRRADVQALMISTGAVSILCSIFVYPLPSSPTFFDAFGRIIFVYGTGAGLLALFSPPQSRSLGNIGAGTLIVAFLATMVGMLLEKLFS